MLLATPTTDIYVTAISRSNRMHNLHRAYVLAKRKATRMKKRVKELMERDGVLVSKATHSELKHILMHNFSEIAEKYPENTFQRIFGTNTLRQHQARM